MTPDMPDDFARLLDDPAEGFAEFRIDQRRVTTLLIFGPILGILGVALLVGGVLLLKQVHSLLHWMIALILAGLAGAYKALNQRRSAVLLFSSLGCLWINRRGVEAFRWHEIESVFVNFNLSKLGVILQGDGPSRFLQRQEKSDYFVVSGSVTLRRVDGVEAVFTPLLQSFDRLARAIQLATFNIRFPDLLQRLETGVPLTFGDLIFDRTAIRVGKKQLDWPDVGECKFEGRNLDVYRKGKWLAWHRLPIASIPNPHLLAALLEHARALPELPVE